MWCWTIRSWKLLSECCSSSRRKSGPRARSNGLRASSARRRPASALAAAGSSPRRSTRGRSTGPRRADHLIRLSVVDLNRGAECLVTAYDLGHRLLQERRIEIADQHRFGDVIHAAVGIHLVQEPQALLPERERHPTRARYRHQRGNHRLRSFGRRAERRDDLGLALGQRRPQLWVEHVLRRPASQAIAIEPQHHVAATQIGQKVGNRHSASRVSRACAA